MREAVKHRFIGGAILVAVAVLFLPSFFKDRQQYQVDTDSQIPQRPEITTVEFNDPSSPEGIEPAPAPETMFVPDESTAVTVSSAAISSAASSSVALPEPVAPTVPTLNLNKQGLPEAWVLQVASLSTEAAANKLRDQLTAQGYKAYVRASSSGATQVYRIYVGPNLDKAQVQDTKQKLDKQLKVNSLVLPFKP